MKQQEYEEARELLLLEAKLVRLRIEAENLKLRKVEESKTRQGNQLIKLADVVYQLSQTRLLSQRSLFSTSRRRHWIWLVLSGALLMVGLVGLLFGLNRVLTDVAALWVFFGIFFVSLLIITVLFRKVSADYREQGSRVAETLQDIRSDIAYLRGEIDKDADDEATGV